MQDEVLNDLQFSEFSDELDVPEHLPLCQILGVLLVARDRVHGDFLILVTKLVPEKVKILLVWT